MEGGGATWPSRRRKDIFFPLIIITRRSSEIKAHLENFFKKFRYAKNTAVEGDATRENRSESAEIALPQFVDQCRVRFERNGWRAGQGYSQFVERGLADFHVKGLHHQGL